MKMEDSSLSEQQRNELQTEYAKGFDSFANFFAQLGQKGNPLSRASTYEFDFLTRRPILLDAMYRGSWVIRKGIDIVADDMTRGGINIELGEEKDVTKKAKLESYLNRKKVHKSIREAIKWARLYGGAISVILIKGQNFDTPLDVDSVGLGMFGGLVTYDRWQIVPDMMDTIDYGPNIGEPKYYFINTFDNTKMIVNGTKIHHSRLIKLVGDELPYRQRLGEQYWGASVIEALQDRVSTFDEVTFATASLVNHANNRVVSVDRFRELLANPETKQTVIEMFEMIADFQSNNGMTLIDKNDEYNTHQYTFSGLGDVLFNFMLQVSGSWQIPVVRFFGQSPSGFNATGEADLKNYYDMIGSEQEEMLGEHWVKICAIAYRSKFGKAPANGFDFSFVPLNEPTEKEKSEISTAETSSILAVFDSGIIKRANALRELKNMSSRTNLFSTITDEDITEAEKEDKLDEDMFKEKENEEEKSEA